MFYGLKSQIKNDSNENSTAGYTCTTRYKIELQRLASGGGDANADE